MLKLISVLSLNFALVILTPSLKEPAKSTPAPADNKELALNVVAVVAANVEMPAVTLTSRLMAAMARRFLKVLLPLK